MLRYKFRATLLSALYTTLVACGGLEDHKRAQPTPESEPNKKWQELRKALKLPDHPGTNRYLTDASLQKEYQQVLAQSAERFTKDIWKTKCAAIDKIKPHPVGTARDNTNRKLKGNIYVMTYRLQRNAQGEPEEIHKARSGILAIPTERKGSAPFPLLMYAHGGDNGLDYQEIAEVIGGLQENFMVLAPTYPGEPLVGVGSARVVGERNPWSNDVDDYLGMHDCIARYSGIEQYIRLHKAAPQTYKIDDIDAFRAQNIEVPPDAKQTLNQLLFPADATLSRIQPHSNFTNFYGKTLGVGSSRGGLVAILAQAKIGAQLQIMNKSGLLNRFLFRKRPDKHLAALNAAFGIEKFGVAFPMISGIATIGAPSSITVGSFRVILEQIVKGQGAKTVAANRPGIRHMMRLFDDYLEGKVPASEARFTIIQRDLTYLAPLVLAATKDWDMPLRPGSMFFMHGTGDRIVPDEQTKAAVNTMIGVSENSQMRAQALSPLGMKVLTRIFERNSSRHCQKRDLFHVNACFFNSHASLPPKYFVFPVIKNWIREKSNPASMKAAYRAFAELSGSNQLTGGANPVTAALLDDLKPLLDPRITKELTEIMGKNPGQTSQMMSKVENYLENSEAKIFSSANRQFTEMKVKSLRTISNHLLEKEWRDSGNRYADLFQIKSNEELLSYFKSNPNHRFIVETLLKNGQKSFED